MKDLGIKFVLMIACALLVPVLIILWIGMFLLIPFATIDKIDGNYRIRLPWQ